MAREWNKSRIVYALLNGTLPSRVIESSGTRHGGDRCTGPSPLSRVPLKQHPRTSVGARVFSVRGDLLSKRPTFPKNRRDDVIEIINFSSRVRVKYCFTAVSGMRKMQFYP